MNRFFSISFTIALSLILSTPSFAQIGASSEVKSTAMEVKLSDQHKLILTTTDGLIGVEKKAMAINALLESAPIDTVIVLAFTPSNQNDGAYRTLTSLISPMVDKVRAEKNVRVWTKFISPEAAEEGMKLTQQYPPPNEEVYIHALDDKGVFYADSVPTNYVEKLERDTFLNSAKHSTADFGRSVVRAIKNPNISGLTIATVLTAAGASVYGPSWVYISNGDLTAEAMATFALSTAILYSVPRHEGVIRRLYEMSHEWMKSGWNIPKFLLRKYFYRDKHFYLSESTNLGYNLSRTMIGALGLVPFQILLHSMANGTEILSNPEYVEFMPRNSLLLGAASAPWTFATDKLKRQTEISPNLVTTVRTAQMVSLGALAVGIPYGMELSWTTLNSPQEAILVGMGVLGLAANRWGVKLFNKLDDVAWWKYLNKNFEAITNAPGNWFANTFRKLSGSRGIIPYRFRSFKKVKGDIKAAHQCENFLMRR